MKVIKKRTITEIIEGDTIPVELEILGEGYILNIIEVKSGCLRLDFYKQKGNMSAERIINECKTDFKIIIGEKGLSFERLLERPNHDHDDTERLLINEKGEPYWGEDYNPFRILFGKKRSNF